MGDDCKNSDKTHIERQSVSTVFGILLQLNIELEWCRTCWLVRLILSLVYKNKHIRTLLAHIRWLFTCGY